MMNFDAKPTFDYLRNGLLGPTLSEEEVSGCNAIFAAMDGMSRSHCAYALATAYHETRAEMQPVREAYWLSEAWRRRNLRYYPWYGRGYVPITWEANYQKADKELGLGGALMRNLDLALNPDIAAKIMRQGMEFGWFGRDSKGRHTLKRHLPDQVGSLDQFISARRIINVQDRARPIALIALQFQEALRLGNW